MRIPAYAKINLFLDVGQKREDGFHDVRSVMHSVSLCDYITLETGDDGITVTSNNTDLPLGRDNIVHRAAELYFEKYGIKNGSAHFTIEKNIPVSAGLAGGSTDGAAALKLLANAYNTNAEELFAIAEELGSDVPFCLKGGTCITLGRGEKLTPIENSKKFDFVICKAGDGISTPAAYKEIDKLFGDSLKDERGDMAASVSALAASSSALAETVYNIFESVVLPVHKEAADIRKTLTENGALAAMVSGSGPSVFGIFEDKESAEVGAVALKNKGYIPFLCESV